MRTKREEQWHIDGTNTHSNLSPNPSPKLTLTLALALALALALTLTPALILSLTLALIPAPNPQPGMNKHSHMSPFDLLLGVALSAQPEDGTPLIHPYVPSRTHAPLAQTLRTHPSHTSVAHILSASPLHHPTPTPTPTPTPAPYP